MFEGAGVHKLLSYATSTISLNMIYGIPILFCSLWPRNIPFVNTLLLSPYQIGSLRPADLISVIYSISF